MYVLRKMVEAVRPGGLILDLQVIRPNPVIEGGSELLSGIDGEPLFDLADAASSAVDAAIAEGWLTEEAVDDHDVRKHYTSGRDVIEDFVAKKRRILNPERVLAVRGPCMVRERCRLRRLRVQ